MRYIVVFMLAGICFSAHAGKYEAVYNPVIEYNKEASAKTVEAAIKKSLIGRGWNVIETENGMVKAKLNIRGHSATVNIKYGDGEITFEYLKSTNLTKTKRGKELIHRNYNRWVRYLEQDINNHLA